MLSGTHTNPRRLIDGRNKAFLDIEGRPLVRHVVDALAASRHIAGCFVVGPEAALGEVLGGVPDVVLVPQEGKLLSNGWAAYRAIEAAYGDRPAADLKELPALVISCDLPLISPGAIDDFVERAAATDA
ncbi:MAG: NTP transferase domain-containing protein, partial [Pseudomonadota bacterium]